MAAQCFEYLGYYCTNLDAEQYISEEYKSFLTLPEEIDTSNMEMIENVSAQALEVHDRVWTEFRDAAGSEAHSDITQKKTAPVKGAVLLYVGGLSRPCIFAGRPNRTRRGATPRRRRPSRPFWPFRPPPPAGPSPTSPGSFQALEGRISGWFGAGVVLLVLVPLGGGAFGLCLVAGEGEEAHHGPQHPGAQEDDGKGDGDAGGDAGENRQTKE